jgi:hypothetical protein
LRSVLVDGIGRGIGSGDVEGVAIEVEALEWEVLHDLHVPGFNPVITGNKNNSSRASERATSILNARARVILAHDKEAIDAVLVG